MGRSEIRITIARPLAEVFSVYAQPEPWKWSSIRNVRWARGNPWEVGSRLEMEPENAFGIVVDQVLTHFEANRRVEYISHFGGITMQSQVLFNPLSERSAEIECKLEFVGTFARVAGFAVESTIEAGARQFYQELKVECERQPLSQEAASQASKASDEVKQGEEERS